MKTRPEVGLSMQPMRFEEGGFAAATWPRNGEEFAGLNAETGVVERRHRTVVKRKLAGHCIHVDEGVLLFP